MGGNALSKPSIRLDRETYLKLFDNIARGGFLSGTKIYHIDLIPSYRNKLSFGDMDILIPSEVVDNVPSIKRDILSRKYNVLEEVKNGNVTSFGIELDQGMFQVDIINVPNKIYNFALDYFSYNDCGNFIGCIARGIGLKYGHNGLWCIQREEEHGNILKEHLLTTDTKVALNHLGLNYERFNSGFDELNEIFDFIVESSFYSFEKFDLSQRNYRARIRDKKRPNYNKFLEYVKTNNLVGIELRDKSKYMEYHFSAFPTLKHDIEVVEKQHQKNKRLKLLYNGDVVRGVTSLEGKELGTFMSHLNPLMTYESVVLLDEVGVLEKIILWKYYMWKGHRI